MKTFILVTALSLCSISWISVTLSESNIVKVQPGENVTLQWTNTSKYATDTFWSRLVNSTKLVCISIMAKYDSKADYCDGFQSGRFELSTNISTVFLTIKHVDFSDSGLYFCGFYQRGHPVFNEIRLDCEGLKGSNESLPVDVHVAPTPEVVYSDGIALPRLILRGLIVALVPVLIILVVVRICKFMRAGTEGKKSQRRNLNQQTTEL